MLVTTKTKDLIKIFKEGGVFAYPTEAVYGLGCDPGNAEAVRQLLLIKQRDEGKGLILIAADFSQVEKYLKPLNKAQQALTLPSEITYIYPALESAPKYLTGNFSSLAVRISKHPLVRELCTTLDSALVSTSANLSGQPPAMNIRDVSEQLGHKISAVLQGNTGDLLTPTVIRDSISGHIIRP